MMFKKLFLFAFLGLFLFGACAYNETLVFNEDGSGKMKMSFDLSDMMQLMGGLMNEESNDGELNIEKIDTIFYVADYLIEYKDSIATLPLERQKLLQQYKNYGVQIRFNEEKNEYDFGVFVNFENASELQNMEKAFEELMFLAGDDFASQRVDVSRPINSITIDYSFENKVFERKAYIEDLDLYNRELENLGDYAMLLNSSRYKLSYTFPSKIKFVSNPNATISVDRKTLFLEVGYLDLINQPDILDLKIRLE